MIGGILEREVTKNYKFNPQFKLSEGHAMNDSFGCVNALKITDTAIITGGDDRRILLYNQDFELSTIFKGHISNIFCIGTGTAGSKIYSTGNDGYLLEYDINQTSRFGKIRVAHEDSCHNLAVQSNNIILTAGQDYCLKLWDTRVEDPVGVMDCKGRQNCVDFRNCNSRGSTVFNHQTLDGNNVFDGIAEENYELDLDLDYKNDDSIDDVRNRYQSPLTNNYTQSPPANSETSPIFLTCDDSGGLYLYDIRTAFTSNRPTPLKSFNTRLNRIKDNLLQKSRRFDISSARFTLF
jgi:WD40 repeat protein